MPSVTRTGGTTTPTRPSGGGVVRPLYGVVIRDQVASLRADIQQTLNNVQVTIAKGKPNAREIANDGVLQGKELTKAKAAAKDLQAAIKALKPVFGGPILTAPDTSRGNGGIGPIRPMYGVILRDDLSKFRTQINENLTTIRAGINSGQLKGDAKKEAQKAVKSLEAALKDLGKVTSW